MQCHVKSKQADGAQIIAVNNSENTFFDSEKERTINSRVTKRSGKKVIKVERCHAM